MMDTKLRHVIVTGGSRGLGACMVAGLLADGYRVSTCSRSRTEAIDRFEVDPAVAGRFFWGAFPCGPDRP
jgi:3-oxoacyl-[acyl-carrier protein] reductase